MLGYLSGAVLTLILLRLSWIDLQTFRLPDLLTLPLAAMGLILALAGVGPDVVSSVIGGLVGYALFWGIGVAYYWRTGVDGLGQGDAKLFGAAGTWVGYALLPHVLLVAALGGLIFALATRKTKPVAIAFGPWIALGFWLIWVAQVFGVASHSG